MKTDCLFLYVEGAVWDTEEGCLMRRKPRALVVELLIVKVIIKDTEHLWLLVWTTDITSLKTTLQLPILMVFTNYLVYFCVFCTTEYVAERGCTPHLCRGLAWVWG